MKSFHDYEIKSYEVKFDNDDSSIDFILENGSQSEKIRFETMLAFNFENANVYQNVILDITETEMEKFIEAKKEFFDRTRKFAWPIYYKTLEDLKSILSQKDLKVFIISASLGLDGWIIAKKIKIV